MTRMTGLSGTALALVLASGGAAWAQDVTLNVWSWQAPMSAQWDEIFAVYEAANPGVDVVFRGVPGTDYPTVLQTGLSGDGGPDLLMLHPYASVAPYARAGQLRAITPEDVPELSNFLPEAIAAAVIGLARTLGMETIAEGIETLEQQNYLMRIGCNKVQGYLHSKPLPAKDYLAFVSAYHAEPIQPGTR